MKTWIHILSFITLASGLLGKPNVLFIAVDDLRVELGCYGGTIVKSPNIDKLAARGTMFTRAYCQQAVCNPSCASALTGLRPSTLGIWDLPTHFRQTHPDIVTLPQYFKNNGYFCQNIGKIFHNWRQDQHKGDAPSWSVPQVMHYNTHGADKPLVTGMIPENTVNVPRCESRELGDEAYFDGRIARDSLLALRKLAKRKAPFFLGVGFWKPHLDFNAPKKYWDLYDPKDIPMPARTEPPVGAPEIALHDCREAFRSFKKRPGGKPTESDTRTLRHGYYAATSYLDAQVGRVVDELDRLGLARNTIILFWSDHGFHLGENGLWAKTSNYELDTRVPLIIATPDHPGSQKSDALVELLDMYPTLAELAGLELPKYLEGRSLAPLLDSPCQPHNAAAFSWHPRPAYPPKGKPPEVMGYAMRTERYRYVEWRDSKTGKVRSAELYDHSVDPGETRNLSASAAQDLLLRLSNQLAKTHPRLPVTQPLP